MKEFIYCNSQQLGYNDIHSVAEYFISNCLADSNTFILKDNSVFLINGNPFNEYLFYFLESKGFILYGGLFKEGIKYIFPHLIGNPEFQNFKGRCIPKKVRSFLLEKYNYKCAYCGSGRYLQVDHIYPYSKGGSNHIDNLQVLCRCCNIRKKDKIH